MGVFGRRAWIVYAADADAEERDGWMGMGESGRCMGDVITSPVQELTFLYRAVGGRREKVGGGKFEGGIPRLLVRELPLPLSLSLFFTSFNCGHVDGV